MTQAKWNSRRAAVLWGLQLLFLAGGGLLHALGAGSYNRMVWGNLCLYICLWIFCACDLRKRLVLLLFSLVLFVFLSCRCVIDIFVVTPWWKEYRQADILFALRSVAISLVTLYLGALLYTKAANQKPDSPLPRAKPESKEPRLAALGLYLVAMVCFLYGEMDKLVFMRGRAYPEIYVSYDPDYPFWIRTAGYCMPYALCAYLATLPKKKQALPVLSVYLLSAVPALIIGQRSPIVLNALFVFLYCCLRDCLKDAQPWLGCQEKCILLVGIPASCIGLSAVNYLRNGPDSQDKVVVNLVVDLFHKQGVSFRTLCLGHGALPDLPGAKRNFTFGPFIDQLLYGRIGRFLFGTTPLPPGSCAELAARSHKLAEPLAFVAHPGYLQGHGLGSSYLLELYADYGYPGIALYSLLLGGLLVFCTDAMKGSWLLRTVTLVLFTDLFYIPRAAATDWLVFLVQPHFWVVILACLLGGRILRALGARSSVY